LRAENIPAINWLGDSLHGLRGSEVYPSEGLKLEVILPEELLSVSEAEYCLNIKPGSLAEEEEFPLSQSDSGRTLLDLHNTGLSWRPGVVRLLAELRRKGSRRGLARSSILFWNGLERLKGSVFQCRRLPENLVEDISENLRVEKDKQRITYRDDISRFFSMVFEDGERRHSFTWPVPGVFLSLEEYGSSSWERTLRLGSTLAVSSTTRSVLKIYSTEIAFLELGDFQVRTDFARIGCKRLPLASLLEHVGPESSILALRAEGSEVRLPLVRLVYPHTATDFSVQSKLETCSVAFKLQTSADAFSLSAEDMISGARSVVEFPAKNLENGVSREMSLGGSVTALGGGANDYLLTFSVADWPPGFWVLDFHAGISGKWGALASQHENTYSVPMMIPETGRLGRFSDVYYRHMEDLEANNLEAILNRVHKRLLVRYSRRCSSLVSDLADTWKKLFWRLRDRSSVDYFISLLIERPSETVASFWVPQLSLGAYFPELFCHPAERYSEVKKRRDSVFAGCLRLIRSLDDLREVLSRNEVDLGAVLSGFGNFADVARGTSPPKNFDLMRYKAALVSLDLPERWSALNDDEWRPGEGDFLGPMHYRYAVCSMRDTYGEVLVENGVRRGNTLRLLNRVAAFTLGRYIDLPANLRNGPIDLGLLQFESGSCRLEPEHEELKREDLEKMTRFLSLFAQVCRVEPRRPGTLDRFLDDLRGRLDIPDAKEREKDLRGVLSYLLYVGGEVFAFYLLLWEFVFNADLA